MISSTVLMILDRSTVLCPFKGRFGKKKLTQLLLICLSLINSLTLARHVYLKKNAVDRKILYQSRVIHLPHQSN